jgi:hypothetical protein
MMVRHHIVQSVMSQFVSDWGSYDFNRRTKHNFLVAMIDLSMLHFSHNVVVAAVDGQSNLSVECGISRDTR